MFNELICWIILEDRLISIFLLCSYLVAKYGKTEVDRQAIQCMTPGEEIDGTVLLFQSILECVVICAKHKSLILLA